MEQDIKFTCPFCDEEFSQQQRGCLWNHVKTIHSETLTAFEKQPTGRNGNTIYSCSALGCKETTENMSLSFFYIPRRPRGLAWLINAGRYDLLDTPARLCDQYRICSKHFETRMFRNIWNTQISKKAVPTIFSHSLEILNDLDEEEEAEASFRRTEVSENQSHLNSLTKRFNDFIIMEKGSTPLTFSLSIVPYSEDDDDECLYDSGLWTKSLKLGKYVLIYKILQKCENGIFTDVTNVSESSKSQTNTSNSETAEAAIAITNMQKKKKAERQESCRASSQPKTNVTDLLASGNSKTNDCGNHPVIADVNRNVKNCKKAQMQDSSSVSAQGQNDKSTLAQSNKQNNYYIYSLEDIDPLLHQNNSFSEMLHLKEDIIYNNKSERGTSDPPIKTVGSSCLQLQELTANIESRQNSHTPVVRVVPEWYIEHDYSLHMCNIKDLCRLCAGELQDSNESTILDVQKSLNPIFQKFLASIQDLRQNDSLPEKVCSSCVEKLHVCDSLFQKIAEANNKLKEMCFNLKKNDVNTNKVAKVGDTEIHESMKEECLLQNGAEMSSRSGTGQPSTDLYKKFVCDECPLYRVYGTLMDLNCHKALVHEGNTNTTRRHAYACKYCKKKFGSLKEFFHHPCKKKKPGNRENAPVKRMLKSVYTRQYKKHSEGYACFTCGKIMPNEDEIKTHCKTHRLPLSPRQRRKCPKKEPLFACHICGRRFKFEHYLLRHVEMHPNWECKTCGKTFNSHISIQLHKRKHEPDYSRLCHLCGNVYANILQHMKLVHNSAREHPKHIICHICGRMIRHNCLKRHIRAVHECANKNLPCPQCPKICVNKNSLNRHIREAHRASKWFQCEFCSISYKKKTSLKNHLNKHHPSCKFCGKLFATKQAISQHEFTEHNEGNLSNANDQFFFTQGNLQENLEFRYTENKEHDKNALCNLEEMQDACAAIVCVTTDIGSELFI